MLREEYARFFKGVISFADAVIVVLWTSREPSIYRFSMDKGRKETVSSFLVCSILLNLLSSIPTKTQLLFKIAFFRRERDDMI